jgi:hypothetical protein
MIVCETQAGMKCVSMQEEKMDLAISGIGLEMIAKETALHHRELEHDRRRSYMSNWNNSIKPGFFFG